MVTHRNRARKDQDTGVNMGRPDPRLVHPTARPARVRKTRPDYLYVALVLMVLVVLVVLIPQTSLLSSHYARPEGTRARAKVPITGKSSPHLTIKDVSPHMRTCYDAIVGLADNAYVHELCQRHGSLAQYTKILPISDKEKLTEWDQEFVSASYCIQNAVWNTKVFIGLHGLAHDNPGDHQFESASELSAYLRSGQGHARHEIIYMALPPITPRNYSDSPRFYYNGHNFVVEQLPKLARDGEDTTSTGQDSSLPSLPRYIIYSSFAQHFRVVDWLRPRADGVDCEWGGGRLLTVDELVEYVELMGALIDELNTKLQWTPYANYLHQYLFGVQKFGDHEVREGLPFGHIKKFDIKRDRTGHPYTIYWKKHEFNPKDCPQNAHMMARTMRGYMQGYKPAKLLDIQCNSTRNWHHYCDDRPDSERYYTAYKNPS